MGFSIIGAIIGASIILPSILFYAIFPPKNIPSAQVKQSKLFEALERIGQMACLAILLFSRESFVNRGINPALLLMAICIIIYYGLWARYMIMGQEYKLLWQPLIFIPVPMAVFPVLAFSFAALWGQSILLALAAAALAIGHINISWNSYKPK